MNKTKAEIDFNSWSVARNLAMICDIKFDKQMNSVVRMSFFQLRLFSKVKPDFYA